MTTALSIWIDGALDMELTLLRPVVGEVLEKATDIVTLPAVEADETGFVDFEHPARSKEKINNPRLLRANISSPFST